LLYFIKKILTKNKIIGCDIVQMSPSFDINNITANFAARLLKEILSSIIVES
jgi:arginase family enzyme